MFPQNTPQMNTTKKKREKKVHTSQCKLNRNIKTAVIILNKFLACLLQIQQKKNKKKEQANVVECVSYGDTSLLNDKKK